MRISHGGASTIRLPCFSSPCARFMPAQCKVKVQRKLVACSVQLLPAQSRPAGRASGRRGAVCSLLHFFAARSRPRRRRRRLLLNVVRPRCRCHCSLGARSSRIHREDCGCARQALSITGETNPYERRAVRPSCGKGLLLPPSLAAALPLQQACGKRSKPSDLRSPAQPAPSVV